MITPRDETTEKQSTTSPRERGLAAPFTPEAMNSTHLENAMPDYLTTLAPCTGWDTGAENPQPAAEHTAASLMITSKNGR